jgi:hypothetical protein
MSWDLIVTMREGKEHTLSFEDEDEAKAALDEVNKALSAMRTAQLKATTIAGKLVVRAADVRSAEIREWNPGV